ncbi:MAG: DUF4249 domain-containing protein [Saprospiraceae bacterium]|nr:DUF4249 domain-containing protein [Saprospiraceae bacterium]MBP7641766.1 DUF4249 domain-containing protein [Saprospiraceae bacterium]
MMSKNIFTIIIIGLAFTIWSCEQPYTPPVNEDEQELVVEGYIEAGEETNPTFVLVTRSLPFVTEVDAAAFEKLFISDAIVTVNDGSKLVTLTPLCLKDLPEEIRKQAATVLGIDPNNTTINICAYIDLFDQIDRKIGGKYDLNVKVGSQLLTASTTIPNFVGVDSFRWAQPPGEPSDTLAQLSVTITDPVGKNYYRYLTQINDENLIAPFTSVTDDAFFDGKNFEFPLQKAERRTADLDPNTFGLFLRGDSVTVKWATIDKAHFDFWNTRDNAANSGGPFSSYIRIKTNVTGGQGIWGGYAVGYYRLKCPEL